VLVHGGFVETLGDCNIVVERDRQTDAAVEAFITLSSLCRAPRVGSGEE